MDLTKFAVCFLSTSLSYLTLFVCRFKETKVESNAPHKITVLHVHTNFEQWKCHKTMQKQTKGTERHSYTADTQTQQKALSRRNTQTVKHIQTNTLNHTQNPKMHTVKLHHKLRKQKTGRQRTKHKLLNTMHFFQYIHTRADTHQGRPPPAELQIKIGFQLWQQHSPVTSVHVKKLFFFLQASLTSVDSQRRRHRYSLPLLYGTVSPKK